MLLAGCGEKQEASSDTFKVGMEAGYAPFNWTAFMFPPIWLLFRKLWKHSIVAALINFVLNIPTFIMIAAEAGMLSAASPLMFPGIEILPAFHHCWYLL